jgi:hypothetical protein
MKQYTLLDMQGKVEHDILTRGYSAALRKSVDETYSWYYTIGLTRTFGQPEIVCAGLHEKFTYEKNAKIASIDKPYMMIANVIHLIFKKGLKIDTNKTYSFIAELFDVIFIDVDPNNRHNVYDFDLYACGLLNDKSSETQLIQMVWSDENGKFPWEEGFNAYFKTIQPLLDKPNTSFMRDKIYEVK